jgi:ribosomal protein L11 methyltransferase
MPTVEVTLSIPSLEHDRYVGWLAPYATGFVETDAALQAYVPPDTWSPHLRARLAARLRADGYDGALSVDAVPDQNWNETWEASFEPVRVGPFLLCSTTAEVSPKHRDATVLRIDPEMSFGTGHHATTRLALRLLAEVVTAGDRGYDVGTGTGVLAIAACRRGAASVEAVDTDPRAVANATTNAAQNEGADCVTVREGSAAELPEAPADIVLTNITCETLLSLLPVLRPRVAPTGHLILSGLLTGDADRMRAALADHALAVHDSVQEDGWWAVWAQPSDVPQ